jgi:hypothetical protein
MGAWPRKSLTWPTRELDAVVKKEGYGIDSRPNQSTHIFKTVQTHIREN